MKPFDGGSGGTAGPGPVANSGGQFSGMVHVSSERYADMDRRQSYFECTQHDYKRYDFDGRLRRPGPPTSQPLLTPEVASWYVPLAARRPSSPYRLARVIVEAFTTLIFGDGRWPSILVPGDDDMRAFCEALVKATQLPLKMVHARNLGGSMGSVGLSWCFKQGLPRVDVHNAKNIAIVEWADRDALKPGYVVEAYAYPREEWDPAKRRVVKQLMWWRRDWTPDADLVYKEVPYEHGKEPQWEVDEAASVEHGDGVPHFVWVQNLPSDDIDGVPDYDGLYESFDVIDILLSTIARGAILNLDPTMVLKMDPDVVSRFGIKKGSDNALKVGTDGDAHYMELNGAGIEAGIKLFEAKRRSALEVAQCVIPDPNELAASGMSSVAMKVVYAPMLQKGGQLRDTYGPAVCELLEQMTGSGDVVIEDTALWKLSPVERDRFRGRRIGLVFQSFHLIEAVGVAANLRLAASCAGLRPDDARVRRLLGGLGIGDLHGKPADRISHGQAQRVAVARALVNRPAVVLADEPTSALDDASAGQLLTLLKETAASEGAGLIIATHDRRVIDAVDETVELRPLA